MICGSLHILWPRLPHAVLEFQLCLRWARQDTSILRFEIDDQSGKVDLSGIGEVSGRVRNSFSVDEQEGYLRITSGDEIRRTTENRTCILQQNADQLQIVGRSESMASGEVIRSVRFAGDTAYVVTFPNPMRPARFVDPLFTLDLSDPTQPRILGELEIPGFSNYLQPTGDDFLIGLGRDADKETGQAEQLQLSLFDVSELSQPKLADRYTFDVPEWADSAFSFYHLGDREE